MALEACGEEKAVLWVLRWLWTQAEASKRCGAPMIGQGTCRLLGWDQGLPTSGFMLVLLAEEGGSGWCGLAVISGLLHLVIPGASGGEKEGGSSWCGLAVVSGGLLHQGSSWCLLAEEMRFSQVPFAVGS
eukprot:CAMPEP_0204545814 /NCGR_PEP_ID=MMETSP0661-20131031/21552_1 /ASSEMBLY_ACC=CAM_ASM_000606 /TAXON_ID=109239 /ORGANISM="Alexandrium margalefi, Strain AMGDE01CS-322" /LENGTH=129 /DNA_ID=CAMNT_0051552613 /DNA_START=82 /DNA_END=473 /DNA_ORIENTATION=-